MYVIFTSNESIFIHIYSYRLIDYCDKISNNAYKHKRKNFKFEIFNKYICLFIFILLFHYYIKYKIL